MGKVLKKMGWDRTSYVISTKVFWGGKLPNQIGLSKKHIIEACNNSLKRMQHEYVDLFFCHRPDKNTPIEETVRAMQTLLDQGKILYWGTSEWSAQEIMEAYSIARQYGLTPPTMEQPQYNMFHRQRVEVEYSKLYSEIGLGTTIWSPLASGILSNRHFNGIAKDSRFELPNMEWLKERLMSDEGQANLLKAKKLNDLALELGISLPQLAVAWCLKNKHVSTVMLGASKLEQLKESIKSNEYQQIISSEIENRLEEILQNKPLKPQF
jgi:voltage-dependent potassium channel beta subunit